MITPKVGMSVAAPVCTIFPNREQARSKCGYDIGTVIAVGTHKKTKEPAVKVRFQTADSVWAKRVCNNTVLDKWCFAKDCDPV